MGEEGETQVVVGALAVQAVLFSRQKHNMPISDFSPFVDGLADISLLGFLSRR
ncbi:MAG: hypothetical protein ACLP3C_24490 [Mycobacterium sp.]|uniref:hypothetical protein n=1 Tax=Mycobacterium sp. TaxID=1785 RepID=UPI003F98D69E